MTNTHINVGGHKVTVYDVTEKDAELLISIDLTAEAVTGSPTMRYFDASALAGWKLIRVIVTSATGTAIINQTIARGTCADFSYGYLGYECYPGNPTAFCTQVNLGVHTNYNTWQYTCLVAGRNAPHLYVYKIA